MIPGLSPDHLLSTKPSPMRTPTATQQSNSTFMHRNFGHKCQIKCHAHAFKDITFNLCLITQAPQKIFFSVFDKNSYLLFSKNFYFLTENHLKWFFGSNHHCSSSYIFQEKRERQQLFILLYILIREGRHENWKLVCNRYTAEKLLSSISTQYTNKHQFCWINKKGVVYADRGLKNLQEHSQFHPLKSEYQRTAT